MTGTVLVVRILLIVLVLFGLGWVMRSMVRYGRKQILSRRNREAVKVNRDPNAFVRESRKANRLNAKIFSFVGKDDENKMLQPKPAQPEATMPIVIMPRVGRKITGSQLEFIITKFGFQPSPNNTYEVIANNKKQIFCTMINIVDPGKFPPIDELKNHEFEGLMLILQLPISDDPVNDWETFYALVSDIAETCDGRLCDYSHALLGEQDIKRYHKAVKEFEQEYLAWQSQS